MQAADNILDKEEGALLSHVERFPHVFSDLSNARSNSALFVLSSRFSVVSRASRHDGLFLVGCDDE